jgi:hypothetical protein
MVVEPDFAQQEWNAAAAIRLPAKGVIDGNFG